MNSPNTVPAYPFSDRVLSVEEAAVMYGVNARTLRRMGVRGEVRILRLSPRRSGIRLSELNALIERKASEAGPAAA